MEDQENKYTTALEYLNQNEAKIKEDFKNRANQDQKIHADDIESLLEDISEPLGVDCTKAINAFTPVQNKQNQNQGNNLSLFGFYEFMGLLEIWLQQQASNENKQNKDENQENLGDVSAIEKKENEQTINDFSPRGEEENNLLSGYEKYQKLLQKTLDENKEVFEELFREKLGESEEEKLTLEDCVNFVKECLEKGEIYLKYKDTEENPEDPLNFENNKSTLNDVVEKFFVLEKGVEPDELNLEEVVFSFDECFDLINYWLKIDENLVLKKLNGEDEDEEAEEKGENVRQVILDTIEKYEKMKRESNNELENEVLQTTIDTLKAKLREIDNKKDQTTIDPDQEFENEALRNKKLERKKNALKEIFEFYCVQQLNVGRSITFDRLGRLLNTINIGTFTVFLKNFRLKIDHAKLVELFKKTAHHDDNLEYDEFEELLNRVALCVDIISEIKTHEPRPEIRKEYKPDSYKKDSKSYKSFKESESKRREKELAEKRKNPKIAYQIEQKRNAEKLEEIWQHMGLYNGTYRSFMGMVNLPFNSHEKEDFRIKQGSVKYKYQATPAQGRSALEIQEEINQRGEMKKLVKELKGLEKNGVRVTQKTTSLPPKKSGRSDTKEEEPTYQQKQSKKPRASKEGKIKTMMTLKKLENMSYGEVIKTEERFNPHDLIEENDDEDKFYLAEYNIHTVEEKQKIEKREVENEKKFDNYGKLKKASKGFAVNGKYGRGGPPSIKTNLSQMEQNPHTSSFMQMDPTNPYLNSYINGPEGYGNYAQKKSPQSVKSSKSQFNVFEYQSAPISGPNQNKAYKQTFNQGSHMYQGYGGHNGNAGMNGNYNYPPSNVYGGYQGYNNGPGYQGYHGNSVHNMYPSKIINNGMFSPVLGSYNAMMGRANQIENESRKREQAMMNNVQSIQKNQMQKGLKAVGKY